MQLESHDLNSLRKLVRDLQEENERLKALLGTAASHGHGHTALPAFRLHPRTGRSQREHG